MLDIRAVPGDMRSTSIGYRDRCASCWDAEGPPADLPTCHETETMTMPSTITEMMKSHPAEVTLDRELLADCVAACVECAQACTACADACLSEEMVAELVTCIRTDLDCADICETTGRVLSRHSGYDADTTRAVLQACAQACGSCAEECERHADMHEHCRVCAEACRRCEDACNRLLAAIG